MGADGEPLTFEGSQGMTGALSLTVPANFAYNLSISRCELYHYLSECPDVYFIRNLMTPGSQHQQRSSEPVILDLHTVYRNAQNTFRTASTGAPEEWRAGSLA